MKNNLFCIAVLSLVFYACGNETKQEAATATPEIVVDSSKSELNEYTDFKFHLVIANIPSPFETVNQLSKSGIECNKELLNKPENEAIYLTSTKKAMNYGVYGVDLVYLANCKEFSQISKYLKTAHNLSASLDALESFDRIAGSRLEENWGNKEVVTKVVDEVYAATDEYLRNNDRELAATQILTGGWVESQYITLNVLIGQEQNAKNQFLFEKTYEQKLHLQNLTNLLKDYENESDFKPIILKLAGLNEEFKNIHSVEEITSQKIKELVEKITAIRDLIVK